MIFPVNVVGFYEKSTILVTGGTGFLGKVLVEKLLRDFNVKKIILLIRAKGTLSACEREKSYLQESIFERLRNERPDFVKQIVTVETDFEAHDLNISDNEMSLILNEVEIVFNIVASVKFSEKFKDAFEINVLGTKKIVALALKMKNLKSFLHISTLYSNCNLSHVEEKIYGSLVDYGKIIEMTRFLNTTDFENIHHCLIGEMPNTYTMTKKCSENLVHFKAQHLPAGIFRPPIVLSTYKEPMPGWTDNLNGPSGTCAMSAKGIIHVIYGNANVKANLCPVDYCINAIIAAGWDVNRRHADRMKTLEPIPVYNYMYSENNLTWGQYMRMSQKGYKIPMEGSCWSFNYTIVSHKQLFACVEFLVHTIPGYILDVMALLTGQKRVYSRGYEKVKRVLRLLSYFGLKKWTFQNDNIRQLAKILKDKQKINDNADVKVNLEFDIGTIDWKEFFDYYLYGIKKYYFKDNFEKMDKLKERYKRFCFYHTLLKFFFLMTFSAISARVMHRLIFKKISTTLFE